MLGEVMDRLEKLEKIVKEIYPEVKHYKSELELLKDITSDLVLSFMEERLHLRELRKQVDRLEKQIEKDHEWARKKWGEMANRLGTLTEDIFAPGIPHLVQGLGYRITKRMLDVEFKKDGLYNQYDAIVEAENEKGKRAVFVAEVKSQLDASHFDEFKKKLENLLLYEPGYRESKIIPILAAFRIPEDLINLASKRGVLLVRMGGEYLEPLNPEVVK